MLLTGEVWDASHKSKVSNFEAGQRKLGVLTKLT